MLDLNGTLLQRTTSAAAVELARSHPKSRTPDATVRGNALYLRPGLAAFMRRLFALGSVAVWTSAMADNAVPMVMHALGPSLKSSAFADLGGRIGEIAARHAIPLTGDGCLSFLWAQDECDASDAHGNPIKPADVRRAGGPKPHFRKDLARIWKEMPAWDAQNTLIIDDSPAKIAHERNHVVLAPFDITDHKVDFGLDTELDSLAVRLGRIVREFEECSDVRAALSSVAADDLSSAFEHVEL